MKTPFRLFRLGSPSAHSFGRTTTPRRRSFRRLCVWVSCALFTLGFVAAAPSGRAQNCPNVAGPWSANGYVSVTISFVGTTTHEQLPAASGQTITLNQNGCSFSYTVSFTGPDGTPFTGNYSGTISNGFVRLKGDVPGEIGFPGEGYAHFDGKVVAEGPLVQGEMYLTNGTFSASTSYLGQPLTISGTPNIILQAQGPIVGITSPTPGLQVTGTVFTVTGTAVDAAPIEAVYFNLNNSGWNLASTGGDWSDWTADVVLTAGTNEVDAYATDIEGNSSAIVSRTWVCVIHAPLTVLINGKGTVTPNYNGQSLQLGNTYVMTASAISNSGFIFTNWTGSLNTNQAKLSFIMASNLSFTANFVDTQKPTLAIGAPKPVQHWSNEVFSAAGTASDNDQVASVSYQLNGQEWSQASTANGWSNWNTTVMLTPGTNVLSAFAVDRTGNISTTGSVSFVYILSAPLTILLSGQGSVTPDYNGQLLQLGQRYSMTAAGSNGFAFANWSGSLATNNPTLAFLMASNLSFTATFVDTQRPLSKITFPKNNARFLESLVAITGTASDNDSVASVFWQLNGDGWQPAFGVSSNWSGSCHLAPGTNIISTYAVDASGNYSTTNSVTAVYVLSAPLSVTIQGEGQVQSNYNGQLLPIGVRYTMTATATNGFKFTNWMGGTELPLGLITNGPTVQFLMASNLMLQANFVDMTKPTLSILAPTSGQHLTNALATLVGTASDNWGVASVWYQLNDRAWEQPITANGWTNWMTKVELQSATNTIKAYAVDLGGNFSTTNSVSFVSSNAFKFQLAFTTTQPLTANGLNFVLQISPGLNGHVQVSTDLVHWITLTNFTATNATINVHDSSATNFNQRFYRAVIP